MPTATAPRSLASRVPLAVWILLPLAIGLLYAAGHSLFAPKPTPANLAPPEAVLVQRFKNLDLLDDISFGPRGRDIRAARDVIAGERNVPGLPGVDHTAPIHLVLLPRGRHQDASMAIFRLEDAGAFEDAFMRTDFLERKLIRHAQHLHIRGGWAAVGPSRDATRRMGRGSLHCKELGEDYAIAADVPGLVEHVMLVAKSYPWRGILESLGVNPAGTRLVHVEGSTAMQAIVPGAQRVERIRTSWDTAKLWGWKEQARIRVDLVPSASGPVAAALKARKAHQHPGPLQISTLTSVAEPPHAPGDAEAWLRIPYDYDRPLLAEALLACGVRFVAEEDGVDLLGGLAAGVGPRVTPADAGGVLFWATKGIGTGYAWTLGMVSPSGHLPPLKAFLPLPAEGQTSVDLPANTAPITKGDAATERATPKGTLRLARNVPLAVGDAGASPTMDVLTFGPTAEAALEGMRNHLSVKQAAPRPPAADWDPGAGMELVASFFLKSTRAPQILGKALEPGGFLAVLAGGHIRGALYTDGSLFRLLLWRAP